MKFQELWGYNYSYLSRIFSAVEGKSIERFLMNCKIQKIKELIRYENESLKQISFLLNYNSPSHMSNHFKKETGMTPSQFKKNKPVAGPNTEAIFDGFLGINNHN